VVNVYPDQSKLKIRISIFRAVLANSRFTAVHASYIRLTISVVYQTLTIQYMILVGQTTNTNLQG
jgi:hypothetical protein